MNLQFKKFQKVILERGWLEYRQFQEDDTLWTYFKSLSPNFKLRLNIFLEKRSRVDIRLPFIFSYK